MKISNNQLSKHIEIPGIKPDEIAEILTDIGLEVEGITTFESIPGSLKDIIVGQVIDCKPHPNADRLKQTTVNVGKGKNLSIVCGAPNVAKGQKVAVALVGAVLHLEDGTSFSIKKSKIRGEVSEGMLCSEKELRLGTDDKGILILPSEVMSGTALSDYFEATQDSVFEIGLTPNRADAMSHLGVARDLKAALTERKQAFTYVSLERDLPLPKPEAEFPMEIQVEQTDKAPRYLGVCIKDIEVKPSPLWLQNSLKAIGLSPINNVVDATNYILHHLGHPLHAFDYESILQGKIVVRNAKPEEKIQTLDGVERLLHPQDLLICDAEKPLCIAGVFGGLHSGIKADTTKIFLESAYFDPVSIRKTAKRHNLHTDASFRYERGIDPNLTQTAMQKAVELIQSIAGGRLCSSLIVGSNKHFPPFEVHLRLEKIQKLLGQHIAPNHIKDILQSLEILIIEETASHLKVQVPPYRVDVQREIDLIEEILRIYGYNRIDIPQQMRMALVHSQTKAPENFKKALTNLLIAQGFCETMTLSLQPVSYNELYPEIDSTKDVVVSNALSQDLKVLRQSMVFGGLQSLSRNLNRQQSDLKFFEWGRTYQKQADVYKEQQNLALFVSGNKWPAYWKAPSMPVDFFYLRGLVQQLLDVFDLQAHQLEIESLHTSIFSSAIKLSFRGKTLVKLGALSKAILSAFDIKQAVFYANFNWDNLLAQQENKTLTYKPLSKYPFVRRDLALLIDKEVAFSDLEKTAYKAEKHLLKKVDLFDEYTGDKMASDKKSYAMSFILQDNDKTLTDNQIQKSMQNIKNALEQAWGAVLRD